MPTSAYIRKDLATLAIAAVAMFFSPPGRSVANAQESLAGDKLAEVLSNTRLKGVPTLAVFSSRDELASGRLATELVEGAWARSNRGLVQVLTIVKENDPAFVKSSGITRFPTVVVYGRGPQGVALLGSISGCNTAEALSARLVPYNLGLVSATAGQPNDPAVNPANFPNDIHASTQYPPANAPPVASAPPQVAQTPPQVPTPNVGVVAAPAGLIQVPGQNFLIQQSAPQVFVAPTQAPIVYVPQMMTAAPGPLMGNVFLPTAPAPQPVMAVAPGPQPLVAATPPATAPMLSSGGGQVAISNQMLSMPTLGNTTRVRVRGPGLLASGLARVGERMIRLGRARIETVQTTELQSPFGQSSGPGLTNINTMTAAPIPQPQVTMIPVSSPPPPPPAACPPPAPGPAPTLPTPQGTTQKPSWWSHK